MKACSPGNENCSLLSSKIEGGVTTPVHTVDAFFQNSSGVHVLYIDAEGFDPLVLQGSKDMLKKHRIQVVKFEYHSKGHWRHISLQAVVAYLFEMQY